MKHESLIAIGSCKDLLSTNAISVVGSLVVDGIAYLIDRAGGLEVPMPLFDLNSSIVIYELLRFSPAVVLACAAVSIARGSKGWASTASIIALTPLIPFAIFGVQVSWHNVLWENHLTR